MPLINRIVSRVQTGADRAALDWAIENVIPHGGWCPKGRLAEDGPIPARYNPMQQHKKPAIYIWEGSETPAKTLLRFI